jgi:hypothetical protein
MPSIEIQICKTPKPNVNDQIKRLMVAILKKDPKTQELLLDQIQKIVLGTHVARSIQAPKIKTKTRVDRQQRKSV